MAVFDPSFPDLGQIKSGSGEVATRFFKVASWILTHETAKGAVYNCVVQASKQTKWYPMDMPKWRQTALEMMPELAGDIAEAETPYILWFSLRDAFEKAYEVSPRDDLLIARIYAYAEWCAQSTRGETATDDLLTCVAVCFWEHIPEHPEARADMPRWFTLEEFLGLREILSYHIGEKGFEDLVRSFRQYSDPKTHHPPRVLPSA